MIVQKRVVYKRFLTKKKLSSFAWTHWGFALITTIGIGFLFTIVELIKIHDRNVVFFNLRTVNSENSKITKIDKEASLNNNSPVFVFMNDNVLFGSLKSVIAPLPNNDVIILSKNWKIDFIKKIEDYKNKKKIFPAKVYGIVFEHDLSYEKTIELLKDTFELINNQNKNIMNDSKNGLYPSVVLLDSIKSY
jgi:hypothetical protein